MTMHRWKSTILALPLLLAAGVPAPAQQPADAVRNLTPVTDEMLRNPPAGDWLMWRRTYDGWGYSPLDQINKDNVKDLKVAWTWSMTPGATETRRSCMTACCSSSTTPTRCRRSTRRPAI